MISYEILPKLLVRRMYKMPKYNLRLKKKINTPLHLDRVSPDEFMNKKINDVSNIEVWEGNKKVKLKSIFSIKKDSHDKNVPACSPRDPHRNRLLKTVLPWV